MRDDHPQPLHDINCMLISALMRGQEAALADGYADKLNELAAMRADLEQIQVQLEEEILRVSVALQCRLPVLDEKRLRELPHDDGDDEEHCFNGNHRRDDNGICLQDGGTCKE